MAVTHQPVFVQAPRMATAIVTGASTDHTDPTGAVLLWDAGTDGSVITAVWAMPRDTVTATAVQLYLSDDGGTTLTLVDSALAAAHTVQTTTAIPRAAFEDISPETPLYLAPGQSLHAGISVGLADGIVVTAVGGDF